MQDEYLGRLKRYGQAEVVEVPASKRRELPRRLAEEGAALEKAAPKGAVWVALDRTGKALSSPELAAWVETRAGEGSSRIVWFIGGSDGLPKELTERAALRLSFGPATFPHQLFRVMLLEQLYRAHTIRRGETYHK
jgi:23S rRNA (pseudouridine1915-N3)-methyltransferase